MTASAAEEVMLMALLDGTESPHYMLQLIFNPDVIWSDDIPALRAQLPTTEADLMHRLANLTERGLTSLWDWDGEPVNPSTLPERPYTDDDLEFGFWFRLTPEGKAIAEQAIAKFAT